MKKILVILAVAVLVAASLTACRKSGADQNTEQQTEAPETGKTAEVPQETAEEGSVEEQSEEDTAGNEDGSELFTPLEVEESVQIDLEEGQEGGY
jgi:uncharacterized protein YxeA